MVLDPYDPNGADEEDATIPVIDNLIEQILHGGDKPMTARGGEHRYSS